jgi:hypothetical protein
VLRLPSGITFKPKAIDDISVGGHALKTTTTTMTR